MFDQPSSPGFIGVVLTLLPATVCESGDVAGAWRGVFEEEVSWPSRHRSQPRSTTCSASASAKQPGAPSSAIWPPSAMSLHAWKPDDYRAVSELDIRYFDLGLGLADCSIMVLARRYEARRLLSFDERHFRPLRRFRAGHSSCCRRIPSRAHPSAAFGH